MILNNWFLLDMHLPIHLGGYSAWFFEVSASEWLAGFRDWWQSPSEATEANSRPPSLARETRAAQPRPATAFEPSNTNLASDKFSEELFRHCRYWFSASGFQGIPDPATNHRRTKACLSFLFRRTVFSTKVVRSIPPVGDVCLAMKVWRVTSVSREASRFLRRRRL